jgi:hypothetical protein
VTVQVPLIHDEKAALAQGLDRNHFTAQNLHPALVLVRMGRKLGKAYLGPGLPLNSGGDGRTAPGLNQQDP